MKYRHRKKILILTLGLLILLSRSATGQKLPPTDRSILLTFRVQSWQTEDRIEIKYPTSVPTQKIRDDLEGLAKAHGWICPEHCFEVTYEKGNRVGHQCGTLSEKTRLDTNFMLDFQTIYKQFSDFETTIIIDIISNNGLSYQGTFSYTNAMRLNNDLLDQTWQNQFRFQKTWTGISNYRIRYVLHPTLNLESRSFPMLRASLSFSDTWLLKTVLLLIFLLFLPSTTLYLFLRQDVSLNEKGKIRLSPFKSIIINTQFPLIVWVVAATGCGDVLSMLTQNRILGVILGITAVPTLSYLFFVFVAHRYEKNTRDTTWTFRENIFINLRMILLGAPAILLPFCFLATQKVFPNLTFVFFLFLLLAQYAILTTLFACVIPLILGWVWKATPLEDEKLRHRLQQLANKAGINYRNIMLLKTKNSKLANAWVAGILPKWRFIFVTDYLLEHLNSEEIQTIFAHELGHLKHRHLLKQALWIVLGFGGQLTLIRLSLLLFSFLPGIPSWVYWPLLIVVNLSITVVLVRLGLMRFWRQMEFQADAYAVQLTQQPTVFLQTLRKLIQLNDAPEDLDTFNEMLSTHPNLTARTEAIEKFCAVKDIKVRPEK